jgi:NadR type nicotinamide-nucleotide adenylyltransferase
LNAALRVVVTGSECTGKTTLARALARHHAVEYVPEYARDFVRRAGRSPEVADVESIATGQVASENAHLARATTLLFLDTDLLSTVVYARHYYGACPAWVEAEAQRRAGDLYLLGATDVPWVSDGAQRDRGDRRDEMQGLFRDELLRRRRLFIEVRGPLGDRLRQANAALGQLRRELPSRPVMRSRAR